MKANREGHLIYLSVSDNDRVFVTTNRLCKLYHLYSIRHSRQMMHWWVCRIPSHNIYQLLGDRSKSIPVPQHNPLGRNRILTNLSVLVCHRRNPNRIHWWCKMIHYPLSNPEYVCERISMRNGYWIECTISLTSAYLISSQRMGSTNRYRIWYRDIKRLVDKCPDISITYHVCTNRMVFLKEQLWHCYGTI